MLHPIRLRGIGSIGSTGELVETDHPGPLQGPSGRRVPVVLPALPSRRLAAGGRRHPGRQGGQPRRGRAPPALRHPDRPLLRAGPPRARAGMVRHCPAGPGASAGRCPHGVALSLPDPPRRAATRSSASRSVPSASTTGAPCCGTPTCPALWERTSLELYRQVARVAGMSVGRAASGGPALLHEGGRVPAAGPGPPPRGRPGRRRRRARPSLLRRG